MALPTRQVMGVTHRQLVRRVQARALQGVEHDPPLLRRVHGSLVHRERLGNDIEHRLPRIERLVRVLEDHLEPVAERP